MSTFSSLALASKPGTQAAQKCKDCGYPSAPDEGNRTSTKISTLGELKDNGQNGCSLCALIVQGLHRCLGEETLGDRGTRLKLEFGVFMSRSLDVTIFHVSETISFVVAPGHPLIDDPLLWSWAPGLEVPQSTDSAGSLAWVRERLQECDSSHDDCKPPSEPHLPTRVLDIGSHPGDIVRLINTSKEAGRYICLSHRWGSFRNMPRWRTLKSNIETHLEGIDWEVLPATFQDAITFTRTLGVRYLWIDSLCIIQDDQDDWRREGAQMAAIYAEAYLVLAAANNEGSQGRMFTTLNPKFELQPLVLPETLAVEKRTAHREDSGVYARRILEHGARRAFSRYTDRASFPLLQRGWVFQERFLSPRTLYFGPEEISWECVQQLHCQCSGKTVVPLPTATAQWAQDEAERISNPKLFHRQPRLQEIMQQRGKEAVVKRWISLVQDYSRLDLTFETDIFPALSGLAKTYQSVLNTRYCAGLWEGLLPEMLLWQRNGSQEQWDGQLTQWRAPSWSWASVKGPVSFTDNGLQLEDKCEVVEVECRLAGPDSTGELTSGRLVLRGLCLSTRLEYAENGNKYTQSNLFQLAALRPLIEKNLIVNTSADSNSSLGGASYIPSGTEVLCLLVGKRRDSETYYGLILKPLSDLSSPMFKRIGDFRIQGFPTRLKDGPSFMRTWLQTTAELKTVDLS